ncbi:hypothetical protein [Phenylobacterium sp.]|jgi:hypothetical protein|uniref:hypothetical protein n=1 Tax=Phenylobacterium sp. TaxID=1871053 RepID=UPI002F419612
MARQAPQEPDPAVVDLARYKRARQALAKGKGKAKRAPRGGGEPVLGARPRAGLILSLMILAMLALWAMSSLH